MMFISLLWEEMRTVLITEAEEHVSPMRRMQTISLDILWHYTTEFNTPKQKHPCKCHYVCPCWKTKGSINMLNS